MRKLLIALFLCLSVCGCNSTHGPYKVAVEANYHPFAYEENGALAGFDVDMAKALCRELKADCEIVPIEFGTLFEALENRTVSFAVMGISITPERAKRIIFSDGYYRTTSIFVSRVDARLSGQSIDSRQIDGKRIAVQQDTVLENYLRSKYPAAELIRLREYQDILDAVKEGSAELAFVDGLAVYGYLLDEQNAELDVIETLKLDDALCIGFNKEDKKLRGAINKALGNIRKSGEHDTISRRYFDLSI